MSAADLGASDLARSKERATVIAEAALAGVVVTPIEDDRGRLVYLVMRWSMVRECESLGEVRALLQRMGAASA
jgi:hypothetical protein